MPQDLRLCMKAHFHRGAELRVQQQAPRVEHALKTVKRVGVSVDHRSRMSSSPGRVLSKNFHAPGVHGEGERFLAVVLPTRCGTLDMIPGVE